MNTANTVNQDNNTESFGEWDKTESRDRDRSERRRERKSRWGDSDNTGDNTNANTGDINDHVNEPPAHEVPDFGGNVGLQPGDATNTPPADNGDQFPVAAEQHHVSEHVPSDVQPTNDNNDYSDHYNETPAAQDVTHQDTYTENDNHDVSDMNVNNEQAVEPVMDHNNHVEEHVTYETAPPM